jgi:hypothetical protein
MPNRRLKLTVIVGGIFLVAWSTYMLIFHKEIIYVVPIGCVVYGLWQARKSLKGGDKILQDMYLLGTEKARLQEQLRAAGGETYSLINISRMSELPIHTNEVGIVFQHENVERDEIYTVNLRWQGDMPESVGVTGQMIVGKRTKLLPIWQEFRRNRHKSH